MKIRRRGVLTAMILIGASRTAAAQLTAPDLPVATAPEALSVLQRPHPDYDALGIRAGSFIIVPTVGLSENYDSNIFATPSQVKGDFYTDLQPGVNVRSDWNNHALNFVFGTETKRYDEEVSENSTNVLAAVNGRLDVLRNFYFLGAVSYQLQHEDRSTPDTLYNQKNPTQYQVAGTSLATVYESGRVGLRLDGTINYYTYDNGVTILDAPIDESYRDRFEYTVSPRVSYEIVPGYSAFIKTPVNLVQYQSEYNNYGYNQSSYGYQLDAGTAVKLTNLVTGEIYVGYLDQEFFGGHSPAATAAALPPLQPTSGLSFGGKLLWNVTELTSVRGTLNRAVEQSFFVPGTTGAAPPGTYVGSSVSLSVEHELQPNILLTGSVGYESDVWQGNQRSDDNYQVNLGIRYLINRTFTAALNAAYSQRSSNAVGGDYQREILTARLNTQF